MSEFWSAFGAIGTTLGSIVTAIAVVIAVCQYKLPMKKSLKINYDQYSVVPPFEGIENDFYCIFISNIGIRNIKIASIYFKIGNYVIVDLNDDMQIPIPNYKIKLPMMLNPEENFDYALQRGKVNEVINAGIKDDKFRLNDKVSIYVRDSSGKSYYKKIKQRVIDLIKNTP